MHYYFISWMNGDILIQVAQLYMAERPHELGDFKKARFNGGTDNHSLKGFSQVSPLPLTDPNHIVIKYNFFYLA